MTGKHWVPIWVRCVLGWGRDLREPRYKKLCVKEVEVEVEINVSRLKVA